MAQPRAGITVEIVYALPQEQALLSLQLPAGTCVREALTHSRLGERFPEIDPNGCAVGIFGHQVALDTVLRDGDRVEIYRPLIADPKSSRRQRAARRVLGAGG